MNIKKVEEIALDVLKSSGKHTTQLILDVDGKLEMYTCLFENEEQKCQMRDTFRKMFTVRKIDKYFFVTEGWMGHNIYKRPSEDKNRKEALIISEYRKDMTVKTIIHQFHRVGKKIVLDERISKELADHKSQWNFYLEDTKGEDFKQVRLEEFKRRVGGEEEFEKAMKQMEDMARIKMGNDVDAKRIREIAIKMIKEGRVVPKEVDDEN